MDKLMSLTGLKKVKARPKRLNNFHRVWLGLGILMDCGCQCAFLICSSGCRAGKFLFLQLSGGEATAVALYKSALQFQQMSPEIRKARNPMLHKWRICPLVKQLSHYQLLKPYDMQVSCSPFDLKNW